MESTGGKLAHIGAEIVLIGGMAFYFNNQIKTLKNEVKELREIISKQQEICTKHINNLYEIFDKVFKSQQQQQFISQLPIAIPIPKPHNIEKTLRKRKPIVKEELSDDFVIEEIDDSPEKELEKELQELEQEEKDEDIPLKESQDKPDSSKKK
jgi:hypothetical protein